MNIKCSKCVLIVFAVCFAGFAGLLGVNWYLDWYNVFRADYSTYSVQPVISNPQNKTILQAKYFIDNFSKPYRNIIYGASRVYLGWDIASVYGNSYYQQTYRTGDLPLVYYNSLLLLSEKNALPDNAIFALNHFQSSESFHANELSSLSRKQPVAGVTDSISCLDWLVFYKDYLLVRPDRNMLGALLGRRERKSTLDWFAKNNFTDMSMKRADKFRKNMESHNAEIAKLPMYTPNLTPQGGRLEQMLCIYRGIDGLLAANGKNAKYFFNPVHYKNLLGQDLFLVQKTRRELVKIFPFIDYRLLNRYTMNNYYWFETNHYTPDFGKLVAGGVRDVVRDTELFMIVSSDNIETVNGKFWSNIKRHLREVVANDPSVKLHPSLLGIAKTINLRYNGYDLSRSSRISRIRGISNWQHHEDNGELEFYAYGAESSFDWTLENLQTSDNFRLKAKVSVERSCRLRVERIIINKDGREKTVSTSAELEPGLNDFEVSIPPVASTATQQIIRILPSSAAQSVKMHKLELLVDGYTDFYSTLSLR